MSADPLGAIRTDLSRIPHLTREQKRTAIRYVCSTHNASDAALLLDVLGLDPKEGK